MGCMWSCAVYQNSSVTVAILVLAVNHFSIAYVVSLWEHGFLDMKCVCVILIIDTSSSMPHL